MSSLRKGLIPIAAFGLIVSLAVCWKAARDLQAARRELSAVTTANEFLKKTLGDMTIAITSKDREIYRLEHVGCVGQEKAPFGVPAGADPRKVSGSDAGRRP